MSYKAHPFAEAWPMLGEEELQELATDIAANGLRDSVVLFEGMVIDGRNRLRACEVAGVEPSFTEFEGDDDEALAFVQSVNNARRHQSKGSLAASWALSMLTAGKRENGRWEYGESRNSEIRDDVRANLGIIADYSGHLLIAVRDDAMSLNAAYQQAEKARDAERDRLEREERLKAEEAEAQQFITTEAPDLAQRVDGKDLQSFVEALDLWKRRNREEAERIRQEQEREKRHREEREKSLRDMFTSIAEAVTTCANYGKYDDMTAVVTEYRRDLLYPPQLEKAFTPEELNAANRFITFLLDWSTK